MLSSLGYAGLRAARIPALRRRFRDGGVVLCYHNVVRERHDMASGDPGLHLPLDRFATQLRWLARHYRIVPLSEMVTRLRAGLRVRGLAALTFDDGYRGCVETAVPLLRELGIPATIFVVATAPGSPRGFWWDHPAVVGRPDPARRQRWLEDLRGDQATILDAVGADPADPVPPALRPAGWSALLAATAQGIELGAHSLRHQALPRLTDAELKADLDECRREIEARTGTRPLHFAYPYGLWDRRVRDAVRRAGFFAAVTLDRGANTPDTDPWALRRVNIASGLSAAAFECWLAGVRP